MTMKTSRFDPVKYLKTDEDIAVYLAVASEEAEEMQDNAILLRAVGNATKARAKLQQQELSHD